MKIFQNPYVVVGLVIVAGVLIFRNAVSSLWHRVQTVKTEPGAMVTLPLLPPPATAQSDAPQPPASPGQPIEPPSNIDMSQLGWAVNGSPHRDPFRIAGGLTRLSPPAAELLTLTAIWRQTGGNLAVINGRILGTGETIEGFKIETIDGDLVWLRSPAGRESLEFKMMPAPLPVKP